MRCNLKQIAIERRGKACPCPNRRKAMTIILLAQNPGSHKGCPYNYPYIRLQTAIKERSSCEIAHLHFSILDKIVAPRKFRLSRRLEYPSLGRVKFCFWG